MVHVLSGFYYIRVGLKRRSEASTYGSRHILLVPRIERNEKTYIVYLALFA